jgi:hypothetical protein
MTFWQYFVISAGDIPYNKMTFWQYFVISAGDIPYNKMTFCWRYPLQ